MDSKVENLFFDFGQKIIGYLPSLLAGIILLAIGWLVGWFIKRVVIQILILLRFERLFIRIRWGRALSKADIRYALFNFVGNIVFFLIFLVFLYSALDALQLTILSHLIEGGVLFFPKLFVALIIFGFGWIVAGRVSTAVFNSLLKENVPQYSLISRFVKFITLIFFSAMALVELNIATEIVIIGFTTLMVCMAVLVIILMFFTGKTYLKKMLGSASDGN